MLWRIFKKQSSYIWGELLSVIEEQDRALLITELNNGKNSPMELWGKPSAPRTEEQINAQHAMREWGCTFEKRDTVWWQEPWARGYEMASEKQAGDSPRLDTKNGFCFRPCVSSWRTHSLCLFIVGPATPEVPLPQSWVRLTWLNPAGVAGRIQDGGAGHHRACFVSWTH